MTPLITIDGFLGLLKKDVEMGNRTRIEIDLGLISDAVLRMQKLLGESLEQSSLGRLIELGEAIPFGEIVEDALIHFSKNAESGNVEITADKDFPSVCVYRSRMVDALMCMIDAFIMCSEVGPDSRILIGHKMEDEGIKFFVTRRDVQYSIGRSQTQCICSSEESEDNGTSMGLEISERIIEIHGGRMWTECGPDLCTIYFIMPEAKNVQ
jgi:light-regulated signal transduction histidine kinase (bacteriophytochrome)